MVSVMDESPLPILEWATAVTPRPLAGSVEELLVGATRLGVYDPAETRSGSGFERVEVDGERCVVKYIHPELDFLMRVSGDIGCRPRRVWEAGLMDVPSADIDHATLGAAPWGRNGWGVALLMRDVSGELVPVTDDPVSEDEHLRFLDHLAAMAVAFWGWHDNLDLLPHRLRWSWFGQAQLEGERQLGYPEAVPRIANAGWERFAQRAPRRLVADVFALRDDPTPLSDSLLTTPQTLLHGDWKFGNLGTAADGRTVLLDWANPGEGPICHELTWYVALNRSRLPPGHSKESTIDDFAIALRRRGIATDPWFERQLQLCLLGAVVQFGWEKALGDDDELDWWCAAAMPGLEIL
jgi:hypothetical protein